MKSFNWPQASISQKGVFLVQAMWYDDLEISEVNLSYSSGDEDYTKLKNKIQQEFEDAAGPGGERVDEWGIGLRLLNLLPEERAEWAVPGKYTLSYHNDEPEFIPMMFQKIEEFLEKHWNREWVFDFWTTGDTFEWKIRKFGLGPLPQRP